MKRSSLFLSFGIAASLCACSNFLDLGGGGAAGEPPSPNTAEGDDGEPAPGGKAAPKPDCGQLGADPVEIFRSPGNENFNVMGLATDGTHVYLAGHMPIAPNGPQVTPDPSNPMKTATLVRVPVAGGSREVIAFEHGQVSRGVVLDTNNIYWASDHDEAVLMRAKSGGPVTAFSITGAGIPQSVATDGNGSIFWATWFGGTASPSNPIAAIAVREPGSSVAKAFHESRGKEDGATQVTADAKSVYWLAGRSELRSAPVSGGAHSVLASGIVSAYTLTTDDDHVWGVSNEAVWKVPKTGGDRIVVTTPEAGRHFRSLAVTDDAIFFSDDMDPSLGGGPVVKGPVYKANKDGSGVTPISPDLDSADDLVADACRVYWKSFVWTGNPGFETVVYARAR